MTCAQSPQGLLVISNDSFLVGLLTGYSAANNFSFRSISSSEPLTPNRVNQICRLIFFDQRSLAPLLTASHFQTLEQIKNQYGIPICTICSQNELGFNPNLPWVNYLCDDNLVDHLDRYITKLIFKTSTLYNERRNEERRALIDRRGVPTTLQATLPKSVNTANYQNGESNELVYLGPFKVDKNSFAVYCKTQNLLLTVKEFKLFMLLAEVHDHVCSTETIIAQLWPNTPRANKSDLYQYMHLLRKKVEDDPNNPQWILTVKGVGYRLNTNELLV